MVDIINFDAFLNSIKICLLRRPVVYYPYYLMRIVLCKGMNGIKWISHISVFKTGYVNPEFTSRSVLVEERRIYKVAREVEQLQLSRSKGVSHTATTNMPPAIWS